MFDVPFLYGGPLGRQGRRGPGAGHRPQQGNQPEGVRRRRTASARPLRWHDREFRVVGVLDDWEPAPKYFDVNNGSFEDDGRCYVPVQLGPDRSSSAATATPIAGRPRTSTASRTFLNSECIWFQRWVELRTAEQAARLPRVPRQLRASTRRSTAAFRARSTTTSTTSTAGSSATRSSATTTRRCSSLAFAFLAVCLVNTVGLLLAKFLNAAPVAGVRRALGASRRDIFWQHLTESGVVALAGGLVGGLAGRRRHLGAARLVRTLRRRRDARALPFDCSQLPDRRRHRGRRRPRSPGSIPPGASGAPRPPPTSRCSNHGNPTHPLRAAAQSRGRHPGGVPDRDHARHRRERGLSSPSSASSKIGRPSGIDDQNIFAFSVTGFEKDFDFLGMVREDLALLRQMPGVIDAGADAAGAAVGQRQLEQFLLAARQEGREVARQHTSRPTSTA